MYVSISECTTFKEWKHIILSPLMTIKGYLSWIKVHKLFVITLASVCQPINTYKKGPDQSLYVYECPYRYWIVLIIQKCYLVTLWQIYCYIIATKPSSIRCLPKNICNCLSWECSQFFTQRILIIWAHS